MLDSIRDLLSILRYNVKTNKKKLKKTHNQIRLLVIHKNA